MSLPRNKAERLALAAAVAPSMRRTAEAARARVVARVDADGNVVGHSTLADVQRSLLERAKIEVAVDDGVRPEFVPCETCGGLIRAGKLARLPRFCAPCARGRCVGCGAVRGKRKSEGSKERPKLWCRPCWLAVMRTKRTACVNGHALSGDNLVESAGRRVCLACRRDRGRRNSAARRARLKGAA